jgi:hypothetical protein
MAKLAKTKGVRYNLHMQVEVSTRRHLPAIRVVPCPECKAELNAKCVTASGTEKHTVCRSRRRIATRTLMA